MGYCSAQFGGGSTWSLVYVVLPNLAESEAHAIVWLVILYVWFEADEPPTFNNTGAVKVSTLTKNPYRETYH